MLLCVDCATDERLTPALFVKRGRTVCVEHCMNLATAGSRAAEEAREPPGLRCVECASELRVHRAHFLVSGESLCIRHAADWSVPEGDDMGAHNMAHAMYLQLGERGVRDTH